MLRIIRNNTKKLLVLLVILSLLSFNLSIISFAESNENTELDINSVTVSNKNATVGDKIKISFRVNNISGDIKYVKAWYSKPIADSKLTEEINFNYNIQNGLFETELEVTNTWINGEYKFNRLFISVGSYLGEYYNSENEYINQFGVVTDLSCFNFTIHGTTGDETPPYIDSSTLNISNDRVVNGDKISYKIRIIDNTLIKSATLKLVQEVGRYEYSYKSVSLLYNNNSNLYEANLTIDDSVASGFWSVYSIAATDKFNNTYTLYNSRFYSTTSTDNKSSANLMAATFKNYQTYPDAKLLNNEIIVDNPNVTIEESLKISLSISDDFKIDNVKLYYNNELDSNNKIVLQPTFEKVKYSTISSYSNVQYFITTTDTYSINKEIEKYGCNGNWILDRIEVQNLAGHVTSFYNKQVYPYSLTDLSSGNFTTYGLSENSIEVDQDNITLDNNKKMQQIECNVILNGVPNKTAKYTSNNENIVIVSPTGLITAQGNGEAVITISSEDNTVSKDINVSVNMNDNIPSITSSIESSGDELDVTTIQLINNDNNNEIFKLELTGNTKDFIVPSIDQGEYILKISKDNHVTREYNIVVDNSNIDLDTKICLIGDIGGDGKVNGKDWNGLYEHINETNEITDYELECADVNGDGKVNGKDWNRLYEHISEVNPLF